MPINADTEPSVRFLEARLQLLADRERDREREEDRQRKENADLRRELDAVRLELAVLKQQVRGHLDRYDRADRMRWQLFFGCAIALSLLTWMLFVLVIHRTSSWE